MYTSNAVNSRDVPGIGAVMAEITPAMIKAERNAELRRVLTEIYAHVHGAGRIIQDMGARLVAEDTAQGRKRRVRPHAAQKSGRRVLLTPMAVSMP